MSYNVIDFLDKMGGLKALQDTNIDHIKQNLAPVLVQQKFWKIYDFPKSRELFRGRKRDQSLPPKEELTIRDLSYPPSEHAKANRANRERKPIFYCADREIGAYQELEVSESDEVIVSYWKIDNPFQVFNIGKTHFMATVTTVPKSQVTDEQKAVLDSEASEVFGYFLGQLFTMPVVRGKNDYIYKLSIALAETLVEWPYKEPILCGGIIYPSTKFSLNEKVDNLALTPQCADQCLKWRRAEHIKINKIRNTNAIDITRLDFCQETDDKGRLIWKGFMDKQDQIIRHPDGRIERSRVLMGDNFIMGLE
jgi:hypothetical protein